MRRCLLAMLATAATLVAQEVEWNELLRQRMVAGQDLIELRYRRDGQGLLEVASCEGGARSFEPLFPEQVLRGSVFVRSGFACLLAFTQGGSGVLGMTDSERHLRRAGVEVSPVALRQFLVAPLVSKDAVRARVEVLDRMVAIDWLQGGGHQGAVPELMALSSRPDTPPMLAARATAALEAFGRRRVSTVRGRLSPETLMVTAVADAYVMVDHAQLPDLAPLRALARRLAVDRSYVVAHILRAPTPDDLYYGQLLADLVGELPFEVARRFGNARCDHTVVAVLAQIGRPVSFAWSVQAAGEFEPAVLRAEWERLAAATPGEIQCERRGDGMRVVTSLGEGECSPAMLHAHSKGMGGRARPELARSLLAEGPAIRVVVPAASKVWAALAQLELPPAQHAELTASFGGDSRWCLTITARDEDAAAAWVARGRKLLASARDEFVAWAALRYALRPWLPGPENGMKPVADAIAAAVAASSVAADGVKVQVVMTGKTLGLEALAVLRCLVD